MLTAVDKATGLTLSEGDACPSCGAKIIARTINRSKNSAKIGTQFLGCSAFPKCRRAFKSGASAADAESDQEAVEQWQEPVDAPKVERKPVAPVALVDDAAMDLASVLQRILSRPSVDVGQVETIARNVVDDSLAGINEVINAAIANAAPTRTVQVIEVRSGDKIAVSENHHYLMPRLVRLLGAGVHVFLWGPPGTGKTTAAMQAAHLLGRESEIDTLDPSTFRSMVQGFVSAHGDEVHTSFTRCWTGGKVYIADECDLAPGHVQTLFNSALANGHAPLAWGNVARNDGFAFVATGNTPGRPTAAFQDRRPMSQAFADRLYFMHWPLDPTIESRLGGRDVPVPQLRKSKPVTAQSWVEYVRAVREWATVNAPTLQVTPRASIVGLQALQVGEAVEDVADGLIFRGCDEGLRSKALANVRMPV